MMIAYAVRVCLRSPLPMQNEPPEMRISGEIIFAD
jgi:hypothetical protein